MEVLNNETAKKGMEIIEIRPWNHHFNLERRNNFDDEYRITKWRIHSIGKRIMRLEDNEGTKGKAIYADDNGNFLTVKFFVNDTSVNFFTFDESKVKECIENIRNVDRFKTNSYIKIKVRF